MAGSRNARRQFGISRSSFRALAWLLAAMQLGQSGVFAQGAATRDVEGDDQVSATGDVVPATRTPFAVDFGLQPLTEQSSVASVLRRPTVFHDALASATPAPPAAPRGSWPSRHPILLGTVIGASTGLVWQGAACSGSSCKPGVAALVGAGAGAYAGLIASAIGKTAKKQPVSRGTKIGIAVGAIGAVVGSFLACYGAGGCGGVS